MKRMHGRHETSAQRSIRILRSLHADFVGDLIPAIRRKKKWKPDEKASAIMRCVQIGEALDYAIAILEEHEG